MRIRGRWRRGQSTSTVARLTAGLVALLDVVTRAVELQAAAEEIIAACATPGDTPVAVARRGGRIAAEYYRLYGWAADLARGADAGSVQARTAELIHYHARILDVCLKLAFPKIDSPNLEHRRCAQDGLGEPGRTLRETRVLLVMWLNELENH